MKILPKSVIKLIDEFSSLPGIGPKTASRLVFYLISRPKIELDNFAEKLTSLTLKLTSCKICYIIAENDLCPICLDPNRDRSTILVVEGPLDCVAIEKTGFQGCYFVLGGAISPIDGIGPDELNIKQLIDRLKLNEDKVSEVILATDPSLEGEATALYITSKINQAKEEKQIDSKLIVTRIARGLPVGGDLEYADEVTLTRSLEGRNLVEMKGGI